MSHCSLIRVRSLIYFYNFFSPARLLESAPLIGTLEYGQLFFFHGKNGRSLIRVWSIIYFLKKICYGRLLGYGVLLGIQEYVCTCIT